MPVESPRQSHVTQECTDMIDWRRDQRAEGFTQSREGTLPSRQRKRLPPSTRPAFPGCALSPSELQTLRQMARGLSYAEAARESRRAPSTVRSLLQTAYERLGVASVAQ